MWFVFPEDITDRYDTLRGLERLPKRSDGLAFHYRFFAVGARGALVERWVEGEQAAIVATPQVIAETIAEGARQLFQDSDALACATAGFHFTHPGGSHSQYFMRGGQTASRVQYSYFLALCLLRSLAAASDIATLWVDTSGIAPIGYAYLDLARRLKQRVPWRVESFGGYDGVRTRLPAP